MSKSNLDSFIDNLISDQVNTIRKVTKAIIEPSSIEWEEYQQEWFDTVGTELLYN